MWIRRGMDVYPHLTEKRAELESRQLSIDHSNLEIARLRLIMQRLGAFLELLVKTRHLGCTVMTVMVVRCL